MRPEEEKRPERKDLEVALGAGRQALAAFLAEVHPADVAEWFQEMDDGEAWRVFSAYDVERGAELLEYASDPVRGRLLERMGARVLARHVEELPPDEAVDLLALTDEGTTEEVLRSIDFERAQGLRELAAYQADTAGGLMTSEFLSVPVGTRVGDAIKELKAEEAPADEEIGVFVVDAAGKPAGSISFRELLVSGIHTSVDDAMESDLVHVHVDDDQEDVAHTIQKYSLWAAPVVDDAGRMVGAISAEDVRDVLEEEAEEDLLKLVGTSAQEQTRLPVLRRVRARMPLMVLTVLGGLVTARVLDVALPSSGGSSGSIGDVLRYLPIIIGLAGNVGIQSSTILVRAFATGEVSRDREASVLVSEVLVGTIIGLLCGGATTVISAWLEAGPELAWLFGGAVGAAISVAVSWAAFLGCVVPLACKRVGIDPAVAAGPFLITLSDISGASIFVGVAHLVLGAAA